MTQNLLENGTDSIPLEAQGSVKCVINAGCDDESRIYGYRRNQLRTALTYAGFVLTAFLLRLVFHWKPEWYVKCTHDRCSLRRAEKLVIKDQYQQFFVHDICIVTRTGARVKLVNRRSLFNSCVPDTHCVETGTGVRLLDPFMSAAKTAVATERQPLLSRLEVLT
uniref:Cation-transporting ATPase n=1 Tax=Macrostomum lignano TaxID=282301 RepID=A0A1I8HN01_9PLAT